MKSPRSTRDDDEAARDDSGLLSRARTRRFVLIEGLANNVEGDMTPDDPPPAAA
jgi:hypothetical protein